jgi:hypothetical protein
MLSSAAVTVISAFTGIALELGIHALTGRREAWDAAQYWTVGLPLVGLISGLIGYFSAGRAWLWTLAVVPAQVLTMMIRSGELGGLWPLAVALSAVLSAPFVAAAFVGSRLRARPEAK